MVGTKRKTKTRIQQKGRFGRFKSRQALREIFVKTPGGRTITQFRKKKPKQARCANCSRVLPGIARERPYKMKKIAKSQKKSERPFGGNLCSSCARRKIINETRSEQK